MGLRWKSTKKRPVHLGFYPLERLVRLDAPAGLDRLPPGQPLSFERPEDPASIVNAMGEYMGMLDAVRIGNINGATAVCPDDLTERAEHLKAFGYFGDAYDIEQVAVEVNGHEPTPNELAKFIEDAKTQGMKTLFVQPQFDDRSAKIIADQLGARVESLDPLDPDVVANIRRIAEAIANS